MNQLSSMRSIKWYPYFFLKSKLQGTQKTTKAEQKKIFY